MTKLKLAALAVVCLAGAVGYTQSARAGETFLYTGPNFTAGWRNDMVVTALQNVGFYGSSMSGSVTFDSVVTAHFTGTVSASDVVAWYLTGGLTTIASGGSLTTLDAASFTFLNGTITDWSFGADRYSGLTDYVIETDYSSGLGSFYEASYRIISGAQTGNFTTVTSGGVGSFALAGAATSVPEPLSLAIAGIGMLGLAAARRRGTHARG